MKRKQRINNTICYIVLILMSIIWLFPFVGLVLQSFRGESGGMVAYLVPHEWSLKNYQFLFGNSSKFLTWYGNTLTIAIFVSLLQTLVVICVSYALSRMRFRGRKALMNIWLVLGMFPGFLTMICLYFLLKTLGLTEAGAVPGLILISVASSGMGYYVCKGYFDTVPKALDEAAILDGATRAQKPRYAAAAGRCPRARIATTPARTASGSSKSTGANVCAAGSPDSSNAKGSSWCSSSAVNARASSWGSVSTCDATDSS